MYDLNASAPEARGNGRRRGKCVWAARMRCPAGVNTGDGPKQLRGSCSCTMCDLNASAPEARGKLLINRRQRTHFLMRLP